MKENFFKRFVSYFLQGLLYVAPLGVTIYVVVLIVRVIDSIFRKVPIVGDVPGTGLVIMILGVAFIGYIVPKVVSPRLSQWYDKTMSSMPLVKLIYTSVRDLMKSFVGEKRKFDHPVMVCLDDKGINHRFGFITQDNLSHLGAPGMVSVYSPYPLSFMGDLIIVPKQNVTPLNIKSADLMKMIVSGGVSLSEDNIKEEKAEEKKAEEAEKNA